MTQYTHRATIAAPAQLHIKVLGLTRVENSDEM